MSMNQGMSLSDDGLALLKHFEGLRTRAYQDSVGVWTIGYGHTKGVKPGDTCTEEEAEGYLEDDVAWAEQAVVDNVTRRLSQSQFDALVVWTFNLGETNLRNSTMLEVVNAGNDPLVPSEMCKWVRAGDTRLKGLARRRVAEASLYLED